LIVALAGRRIDAPGSPERFPLIHRELVLGRIGDLFRRRGAKWLVASAACGADLLAHQAGLVQGLRCRVVLPFERERFKATCVLDRPGSWGNLFDRVCDAAAARGDLLIRGDGAGGEVTYRRANAALLDEAEEVARESGTGEEVLAVVVWDVAPRGKGDISADFADQAVRRGLPLEEVPTR